MSEVEEIERLARTQAEAFLREEFVDRRRRCLYGGTTILTLGLVYLVIVVPELSLGVGATLGGGAGALAVFLAWCAWMFRCTRCERIPMRWESWVVTRHNPLTQPGCPHCGLDWGSE